MCKCTFVTIHMLFLHLCGLTWFLRCISEFRIPSDLNIKTVHNIRGFPANSCLRLLLACHLMDCTLSDMNSPTCEQCNGNFNTTPPHTHTPSQRCPDSPPGLRAPFPLLDFGLPSPSRTLGSPPSTGLRIPLSLLDLGLPTPSLT